MEIQSIAGGPVSSQTLLTTAQQIELLHNLIQFAEWISDDEFNSGFSIYHIELPLTNPGTEFNRKMGFSISARITDLGQTVEVRSWSNYNA